MRLGLSCVKTTNVQFTSVGLHPHDINSFTSIIPYQHQYLLVVTVTKAQVSADAKLQAPDNFICDARKTR